MQTPEGTAASVPVGSTVVLISDYGTGDFSQWSNIQNKIHNGPATRYDQSHYSMRIENAGPGHETAARIEVRHGDVPGFGGGERAEVRAHSLAEVHEGDERWYEFSMKFDTNFPSPNCAWCIVMQWHAGSGSPPLCLEVHADDKLYVQSNARRSRWSISIGDIARGQWVDYVLHAKFSQDSSIGFVEMWRNGTVVVPRTSKKTMTSDESYLKQGLYRGSDRKTMILWHDGLRITAP